MMLLPPLLPTAQKESCIKVLKMFPFDVIMLEKILPSNVCGLEPTIIKSQLILTMRLHCVPAALNLSYSICISARKRGGAKEESYSPNNCLAIFPNRTNPLTFFRAVPPPPNPPVRNILFMFKFFCCSGYHFQPIACLVKI